MKRRMTEEEIAQRDIMRNNSQLALYEEILRSEKDVNLAVLDSIYKGKFNEENYYPLGIDLENDMV